MTTTERRQRFESLIQQAEQSMALAPRLYRVKLLALALLGYVVLIGMATLLLAIGVVLAWGVLAGHIVWVLLYFKFLLLPFLILPYVILRALWVRVVDPPGYELCANQYPKLFAEVEALGQQIKAPRIHRIILTNDFNAGIAQIPRLGVFGWPRNTLVIGLQLLLGLSSEEARAVLAHEMGHLSGQHGWFAAWIYRVRIAWWRIMAAFNQAQHWATRGLAGFFDWYAPYFNAYSFALARTNEYHADAIAAQLTSRDVVAKALVNSSMQPILNDRYYWKALMARAEHEPTPPADPVSGLERFRATESAWEEVFNEAMAQETGYGDVHPALRDRVRAIQGHPQTANGVFADTAARAWLGKKLDSILRDFDQVWLTENAAPWKNLYDQVGGARSTLASLRAKHPEILTKEERWNLAALTEELDPATDPLPLYRKYDTMFPHEPMALLAIGRLLLQRDDPSGLAYLEKPALDLCTGTLACHVAYSYAVRKKDENLADLWRRRAERHIDVQVQAERECQTLPLKEDLIPPVLEREAIDRLRAQLQQIKDLNAAWICQRRLRSAPTLRFYFLVAEPKGMIVKGKALLGRLTQSVQYPGQTFVLLSRGPQEDFAREVRAIGTRIF